MLLENVMARKPSLCNLYFVVKKLCAWHRVENNNKPCTRMITRVTYLFVCIYKCANSQKKNVSLKWHGFMYVVFLIYFLRPDSFFLITREQQQQEDTTLRQLPRYISYRALLYIRAYFFFVLFTRRNILQQWLLFLLLHFLLFKNSHNNNTTQVSSPRAKKLGK